MSLSHNLVVPDNPDHNRDALLTTKIGIPRTRPDLLPRSHLLTHMAGAMARELVLVSTAAGAQKRLGSLIEIQAL